MFDNPTDEYEASTNLAYRYGDIIRTFIDPVARTKDSVTGEYYSGRASVYRPSRLTLTGPR